MFENYVQQILDQVLVKYCHDIDPKSIHMALFKGDVSLSDLRLKAEAFQQLGLPFSVKGGFISKCNVKIPWSALKSSPVVLVIDTLCVVVGPEEFTAEAVEIRRKRAQENKLSSLSSDTEERLERIKYSDDEKRDSLLHRFITKIVDNVQIEVSNLHIRYQDENCDSKRPFAAGISMGSFTARSCNGQWQPQYMDSSKIIHKLVELRDMCVYWKSDISNSSELVHDFSSPEKCLETAKKLKTSLHEQHYVLQPMTCTLKATINKSDIPDLQVPKLEVSFEIPRSLSMVINSSYIRDAFCSVHALTAAKNKFKVKTPRPTVPITGHARIWWKFSLDAVCEDIRRNKQLWKRESMSKAFKNTKEYLALYQGHLLELRKHNRSEKEKQLESIEALMEIETIAAMRNHAELETSKLLQQEKVSAEGPKPSILKRWFGIGEKKPKELTEEQSAALMDIIQDEEEHVDDAVIERAPAEYCRVKLGVAINHCTITLRDSGGVVAALSLVGSTTSIVVRPKSWAASACLQKLEIHDLATHDTFYPTIVRRQEIPGISNATPILSIAVECPPLDHRADMGVQLNLEPLEIICSSPFITRFVQWEKQVQAASHGGIMVLQAGLNQASSAYAMLVRSQVSAVLYEHRSLDLDLRLRAPTVIIPTEVARAKSCDLLVCDLGSIHVKSILASVEERKKAIDAAETLAVAGQKSSSTANLTTVGLYDSYQVEFNGLQIIACNRDTKWWQHDDDHGNDDRGHEFHLLSKVSVKLMLRTAIVRSVAGVTLIQVSADVDTVQLHLSQSKIVRLVRIADFCVRSIGTLKSSESHISVVSSPRDKRISKQQQQQQQQQQWVDKAGPAAVVAGPLLPQSQKNLIDEVTLRWKQIEAHVTVGDLRITLEHETDAGEKPLIRLSLCGLQSSAELCTRDSIFTLSLQSFDVEDCIQPLGKDYRYLVTSCKSKTTPLSLEAGGCCGDDDKDEADAALAKIEVRAFRRDHPRYDGSDVVVSAEFGSLYFGGNLETIAATQNYVNFVADKVSELKRKWSSAGKPVAQEITTPIPATTTTATVASPQLQFSSPSPSTTSSTTSLGSLITPQPSSSSLASPTPSSAAAAASPSVDKVSIKLNASLQRVRFLLFCERASVPYLVASATLGKTQVSFSQNNFGTQSVQSRVGSITVRDLTPSSGMHPIVFRNGHDGDKNVHLMTVDVIRYAREDRKRPFTHDVQVTIRMSPMEITFLSRFISELKNYYIDSSLYRQHRDRIAVAMNTARAKTRKAAARAAAATTRVKMDVETSSLKVFVPRNSWSKDSLCLSLGGLDLKNEFADNKGLVADMPDVVEKVTVKADALSLSSNSHAMGTTTEMGKTSLSLHAARHLFSDRISPDVPGVDVDARMEKLHLKFAEEQLQLIAGIVRGNLSEGISAAPMSPALMPQSSSLNIPKSLLPPSTQQATTIASPHRAYGAPEDVLLGNTVGVVSVKMKSSILCGDLQLELVKESSSCASIVLSGLSLSHQSMSDGSGDAKCVVGPFSIEDTRANTKNVFKHLVRTGDSKGNQAEINVSWPPRKGGKLSVDVLIRSIHVNLVAEPLVSIYRFVSSNVAGAQDPAIRMNEGRYIKSDVPRENSWLPTGPKEPTLTTEEGDPIRALSLRIRCESPKIVLIEKSDDMNSQSATLTFEVDVLAEEIREDRAKDSIDIRLKDFQLIFQSNVDGHSQNAIEPVSARVVYDCEWVQGESNETIEVTLDTLIEATVTYQDVRMLRNVMREARTAWNESKPKKKTAAAPASVASIEDDADSSDKLSEQYSKTLTSSSSTAAAIATTTAKPRVCDTGISVYCAGLVVCIVNDSIGWNIPFVELTTSKWKGDLRWFKDGSIEGQCSMNIHADFFNPTILTFEPLIERWSIMASIARLPTSADDEKGMLSVEVAAQERLEINLCETHLTTAINTLESWTKDWTSENVQRGERYWPYRIRNETGVAITFCLDQVSLDIFPPRLVQVGEEEVFSFPGIASEARKGGRVGTGGHTITVSMQGVKEPLSGLPVDTVGVHMVNADGLKLVVEIVLDGGTKVVALQSAVKVFNKTSLSLEFSTGLSTSEWREIANKDDHTCVPVAAVSASMKASSSLSLYIRPYTGAEFAWSKPIALPNRPCNPSFQIVTCKYGETTFCLRVRIDAQAAVMGDLRSGEFGSEQVRVLVSVHAPLKIENRLPFRAAFKTYTGSTMISEDEISDGANLDLYRYDLSTPLTLAMGIRGFSHTKSQVLVYSPEPNKKVAHAIELLEDGAPVGSSPLYIDLVHHVTSWGEIVVTVFAQYWIVNRTGLPLVVGLHGVRGVKPAPGQAIPPVSWGSQTKPFLFSFSEGSVMSNRVAFQVEGRTKWSGAFSLDGIGSSGSITCKGHSPLQKKGSKPRYDLGVKVALGEGRYFRTKVVTLDPRYVIYNHTDRPMCYCQDGFENDTHLGREQPQQSASDSDVVAGGGLLNPNAFTPFFFFSGDKSKSKLIRFKVLKTDSDIGTMWSGGVSLDSAGEIPVQMWRADSTDVSGQARHLTVHIEAVNGSAIVILRWEDEEAPHYRIDNNSNVAVKVEQKGEQRKRVIAPNDHQVFCWDAPTGPFNVVLDSWGDHSKTVDVAIGELGQYNSLMSPIGPLAVNVAVDGATKVLTIQGNHVQAQSPSSSSELSPTQKTANSNYRIALKSAGFGISIVDKKPSEIYYISVQGIDLVYDDSPTDRMFEMKIAAMQIDNQTDIGFPQVFAPLNPQPNHPLLHLSVVRSKGHKNIQFYKYFSMSLQEVEMNIHETILVHTLNLVQNIIDASSAPSEVTPPGMFESGGFLCDAFQPHADKCKVKDQSLYFELLHIHPLKMTVSFEGSTALEHAGSHKEDSTASNPLFAVFKAVRVLVTNIDRAPLKLNALVLERPLAKRGELLHAVGTHYATQALQEGYKIVGSIEMLGNPVGLVNNLGTGVMDFFYEPAQGLVKSPKDFAAGLSKGSLSLIRNSLYGTFNAVSQITASVGKGLGQLAMDDEYNRSRQMSSQMRPKDFGDGMKQGMQGLGKGFADGFKGIVSQPMKGAESGGAAGFFEGVGKGLVGVAVKPVAGVFDFAAKTAAGVKSSAEHIGDRERAWRVRPPRVIGADGIIKSYNLEVAMGRMYLRRVKNGIYAAENLLAFISVSREDSLFITSEHVVLATTKSNVQGGDVPRKWGAKLSLIKSFAINRNSAVLTVNIDPKKKTGMFGAFSSDTINRVIECGNAQAARYIIQQIELAKKGELTVMGASASSSPDATPKEETML